MTEMKLNPIIELERAVVSAAMKHEFIPINDTTALFQFAAMNKLGCPTSDEFSFVHQSKAYTAQAYELGIVYAEDGHWNECRLIRRVSGWRKMAANQE